MTPEIAIARSAARRRQRESQQQHRSSPTGCSDWVQRPLTILVAIACTGFTYTYFGEAFPITSLSISADQHAARLAAQELRVQLNASGAWARPVEPPREASSFKLDQDCQHFVELRGGGNAAFSQMLSGGVYAPFTWRVRHFLPADAAGTVYLLTPSGEPFGFTTTLPEEEEGANLTSAEALSVARLAVAGAPWAVDFGVWSLVEEKKEARPRRTDHTFTFERPERVGEAGVDASESQQATYRLELAVRGARLASLRRSFKVPEAFSREFEGMRSANEAIAQLAWIGIVVLYGVGGVAMGSWLLMRRNALAAASAAPWSVVLAGGMGGAMGVQMPLQWMAYATELEVGVFQLDYGVKVAVQSAFFLAIVFLSFVAAEGLGRVAFPNQLRLWALMRRPVLQSRVLLDQVLLGYLLVPVMFAYEVAFYFCCKHLLGWWMPSSPLADPDVNATLAPWLPPIAQALFAGFWEEALFRAVPLAATALAAQQRRPFTRRALVGLGFLFQACLFGAAHANYPAQPAHARLVELVLPSFLFGALYWRHGLLPGVIMHYTYDVVWMALPVFLCKTATTDQALVIACAFLPLLLVAAARLAPRASPAASEAERLKPRCRPPLCAALLRRLLRRSSTPPLAPPLRPICNPFCAPSAPPHQCLLRTAPSQPQRQLDAGQVPRRRWHAARDAAAAARAARRAPLPPRRHAARRMGRLGGGAACGRARTVLRLGRHPRALRQGARPRARGRAARHIARVERHPRRDARGRRGRTRRGRRGRRCRPFHGRRRRGGRAACGGARAAPC